MFEKLEHDHSFAEAGGATIMTDVCDFESPLGLLGAAMDWSYMSRYVWRLLAERNRILRRVAQSDEWKELLRAPAHGEHTDEKERTG